MTELGLTTFEPEFKIIASHTSSSVIKDEQIKVHMRDISSQVNIADISLATTTRSYYKPLIFVSLLTKVVGDEILCRKFFEPPIDMLKLQKFIDPATFFSVIQRLDENYYIGTILIDTIDFIQNFLSRLSREKKVNEWRIGITLERDIEEPEWEKLLIIINGDFKFKNLEEKLSIEDQIEKWIEGTIDYYRKINPADIEKINEANVLISVILG
jgi:hypothetical protein